MGQETGRELGRSLVLRVGGGRGVKRSIHKLGSYRERIDQGKIVDEKVPHLDCAITFVLIHCFMSLHRTSLNPP